MRYADRGRFLDTWKLRGSGFDFGRAETFARDLERIVRTAEQEPMAAGVAQRPVAMRPDSFEAAPVRIEIAPRIFPETLGHARPRVQRRKFADRIDYRLAVVIDRGHFYPGYSGVEPAWLDRTEHRASEESARDLGTARVINDGAAPLADIFEQPHVRFGIPYLAGRAKDAQRGEVVAVDRFDAVRQQSAHQCRRNTQMGHAMACDDAPDTVGGRVVGRTFIKKGGRAECQRADNEPRPHHPAHVGEPEHHLALAQVEQMRHVLRALEREARVVMHGALGSAGRA